MRTYNSLNTVGNGSLLVVTVALLLIGIPSFSYAMPVLKHVQVKNSSEFNLVFDGKVEDSQVTSEYVNDIYQLNIRNVAVYPAKIIPVEGKFFSKIFAYQYSPKLVRCRFTLRGKVTDLKRKIKIFTSGEIVTVKLEQPVLAIREQATSPTMEGVRPLEVSKSLVPAPALALANAKSEAEVKSQGAPETKLADAEQAADALDEQALLQKVIRGTDPSQLANKPEIPISEAQIEKPRLTSGKALPAVWPVVGKLGIVILIFCFLALMVKKFKSTLKGKNWLKVAVGRLATKGLLKDREMIQVVSTHHLDPKKSLAVVRVAGRLLVLGVSNDSINLITQIPGDGTDVNLLDFDNDSALAQSDLPEDPMFADFLGTEKSKPVKSPQGSYSAYSAAAKQYDSPSLIPSARSRIKNKLEGLKQL